MQNRVLNEMVLEPVIEDEVLDVIKALKDGSCGWDTVSAKVVKHTYTSFKKPLCHIINMSFNSGIFPSELKVARVIPLFKSGDAACFSNYRPVSVLPVLSKIFERLLYSRLLTFINENNVLYAFQFGFRALHSPNLALLLLVDKISKALEEGDYVLGLFLDFSKAFDTVNHDILFRKLEFYGIRGTPLKLFTSYLCGRSQYVEYNGMTSTKEKIICGVPQGSILGPLLFLIYINDLAFASSKIFSLLFADDSNLFLSGKNPNELINMMNTEITHVVKWLQINKLSINLKKTQFMIFRKRRTKTNITEELDINDVKINQVQKTKFLGVVIDECLTFQNHVLYTKGKISRGLGILYKGKKYFDKKTLLTLYNAFIYPYFTYCIEVWGNTHQTYLDTLNKLQKRAIRIISFSKYLAHTEDLFKDLKLLNLKNIYIYASQLFMYKYHHGTVPHVFSSFFTRNSDIHTHDTRQQNKLHVSLIKYTFMTRFIRCIGVRLYNYFTDKLNWDCFYPTYKRNLKNYLINNDVDHVIAV